MLEQNWIYILFLFIFLIVSSLLKWTKQIKGKKVSLSRFIRVVIIIVIVSLALVVLISLPLIDQPRIADNSIVPAGILLIVFGIILNVFVARQLTHIKFQMKGLGTPDHLITTGLFSIVRHPSSMGVISIMIGWYLAWGALYCIYFVAPVIVIGIFIENKFEERNLEKKFGDEYRMYKKRVGMYFPLISRDK